MTTYEAVIGLEVHGQLLTKTKMFCGCSTAYGQPPNTAICPVCLGLPGALPVPNRQAIALAVRAGLALGCSVRGLSRFARKNYYYPDLSKGYQISQFELPLNEKGHLEIATSTGTKRVGITRIHVEEDAAKNLHGVGQGAAGASGGTLVDFNRAGTALIEIVGEPDLRSAEEAEAYLRALRDVLMFAGVNDGNLEEGSFRCDANVSIRPVGQEKFGTRCELKNINSFKFVRKAIEFEIARQEALVSSGGKVLQETRTWSSTQEKTLSLRSKEEAQDYRYFSDPDLPPLVVDDAWLAEIRASLPEPVPARRQRWQDTLGLTAYDAQVLTSHPRIAEYFESATAALEARVGGKLSRDKVGKRVANFVQAEALREVSTDGLEARFPCSAERLAELLALVEDETINGKIAKDAFADMVATGKSAKEIVAQKGLAQVKDSSAIEQTVRDVVAKHPKELASFKGGKVALKGFFVGQIMRALKGANPAVVNEVLDRVLAEP